MLNRIFVFLLISTAAFAPITTVSAIAEETKVVRSISVSGHGESKAAPDMAMINIGVNAIAQTAPDALAESNKAMNGLMDLLKSAGIDARDLATSNFSVGPRYDYGQGNGEPPKLSGYEVTNMLTVTVRKVAELGTILDQAVKAGSNQVNGISFTVSDPAKSLDEARKAAVAEARHRAEIYAEAGGFKLGDIISVSEGGGAPIPYPMPKAMRADAAGAVPVAQGEQTISADVNIVWEIK